VPGLAIGRGPAIALQDLTAGQGGEDVFDGAPDELPMVYLEHSIGGGIAPPEGEATIRAEVIGVDADRGRVGHGS
jgi:hypothetical protein